MYLLMGSLFLVPTNSAITLEQSEMSEETCTPRSDKAEHLRSTCLFNQRPSVARLANMLSFSAHSAQLAASIE